MTPRRTILSLHTHAPRRGRKRHPLNVPAAIALLRRLNWNLTPPRPPIVAPMRRSG